MQVSVGDQVYLEEGGEEFGAVRHVLEHELIVNIENYGDVTIGARAVKAIHDGKVIIDAQHLPASVRQHIGHAHDREQKGL
jgi:hypothetical protein